MASMMTQGMNRTQIADLVARNALVFVRRGGTDGRLTQTTLEEIAQELGLVDGIDFAMRTAVSRVKANAKRLGETGLLAL